MKMNKFNVGDIIRNNDTLKIGITKALVTHVLNDHDIRVKVLENSFPFSINDTFFVRSEYFELVEEEPKIEIIIKGRKTIAKKFVNGKVVNKGTARCHPNDEFNFEVGSRIAIERLLGLNFEVKKEEKENKFFKKHETLGFDTDMIKKGQIMVIRKNYEHLLDSEKICLYFIKDIKANEIQLVSAKGDIVCEDFKEFIPNMYNGYLEIIEVIKLNEQFK
jgi:hypothetical protein